MFVPNIRRSLRLWNTGSKPPVFQQAHNAFSLLTPQNSISRKNIK